MKFVDFNLFILLQLSLFGGPAWTWNEQRKQFYYHVFSKEQPDFDLRHPDVKEQIRVSTDSLIK